MWRPLKPTVTIVTRESAVCIPREGGDRAHTGKPPALVAASGLCKDAGVAASKGPVVSFIQAALRVRPGEGRRAGLMFFYLMSIVSAFIIGRTVRDTLFLHRVSIDRLPIMYMVVALAVAVAAYGYSHIADKYRRDRLIEGFLTAFASALALLWLLLVMDVAGAWIYPVLYVMVEILGALSMMQFWTFANDIFSAREAKRLFGIIGAGGVLSNIVCGFTVGSVAPAIGAENLVLICALLYFGAIFLVRAVATHAKGDLERAIHRPKKSKLSVRSEGGRVFQSKHLKVIAGIVAVTFLTVSIVDFQFKVVARQTYSGEAELAAFFGYFYGFTGIIASFVQFFITGRLLERSGIVVALCVLPVAILAGAGAILLPFVAAIVATSIAKGAEIVFRYTVNDATMNLLYIPVPSHLRGRAKAFIDGILKPVSIGASGLIMFALARLATKESLAHNLAWFDIFMLITWIGLVVGIRKEYVKSLIDTLRSRRLDVDSAWSPLIDDGTKRALRNRLRSGEEAQILHALELLPSLELDFGEELEMLLAHPSQEVRIYALGLLGASGKLDRVHAVERLMRDPEPQIRAAAIRAFCAIGRERAIRAASPYLLDTSAEVRASAVAALIKHGGLDGILTAAEGLKGFISSADPVERFYAARVLQEIRVQSFFQPVLELLQDKDRKVRVAAVEAAAEMKSRELVPTLIYKLADPTCGRAAVRALVAYGDSIERTLFKVLANKKEDIAVRRAVPRVLGRVGGPEALQRLLQSLDTPDHQFRMNVAWAAARVREKHLGSPLPAALLDEAFRREVKGAYQALATLLDLALPEERLLPEALMLRYRRHLSVAFRLLEIRYPPRTIQLVYSNLDSENKAVRANALEVVDNVLAKDESRILLPLLEDHSRDEKVAAARDLFDLDRLERGAWLDRLVDGPEPWLTTCTMHLIGQEGLGRLAPRITPQLTSTDAVVRETAYVTLYQLVQSQTEPVGEDTRATLRAAAERAKEDLVEEVRRAGEALLGRLAPAT